jgi:hypothetical protein
MPNLILNAKSLKATIVLDPVEVLSVPVKDGLSKIALKVAVGGRTISAEVNAKSLRRCIATVRDLGPDAVAVVLQGKLEANGVLVEAGIAAMPKTPKAATAA